MNFPHLTLYAIMAINESVQPLIILPSRLKSLHVSVAYSEKIEIHLFDCFCFCFLA